jgi:hypothetical protein
LFCRLLRYCLGEDRFAPDEQRYRIANAFPEGLVGAEVMIDGSPWAILRPIGMGRQHFAIPNGDLDSIKADAIHSTGMEPFLGAVENRILSTDVVSLVPGDPPLHAWLVALAWFTRDQECRFDDVLDWRSSASDSGSPVRSFSGTKTLDALRALIGAIVPEEYKFRAEVDQLETEYRETDQETHHRKWEADQLRSRLAVELRLRKDDLPPGRLAVESLREAARAELANVAAADFAKDPLHLGSLRKTSEDAQNRVNGLLKDLAEVEARIPEIERVMSLIKGELPGVTYSIREAENPVCPVCEVPIDQALAEGCKLSHKLPNPEQIRLRWDKRRQEFERESQRLDEHRERKARISSELAAARKHAEELHQRLRDAERARDARSNAWYKAQRLIDDVERLEELLITQEKTQSNAEKLADAIEAKRQQTAVFRDAQATVFHRLSEFFDAIIREIVGPDAKGKAFLDGNGLHLSVEMGGERSTAAIDSLKVLAFDLAVLCMSIEGCTHIPAFLAHDSPREADLGQSLYHQLFRLAWTLEQVGTQPLFQYIVTTTTPPPKELLKAPWLRETLGGTPAEARLLKRDL